MRSARLGWSHFERRGELMDWLQNCSVLDYIILAVAVFMVIRGFIRGCSGELGHLLGVLAAVVILYCGKVPTANMLQQLGVVQESEFAQRLMVLVVMLALCVAAWILVSWSCSKLLKLMLPQPLNAILGGVIGVIKVFLVVCMLSTMGLIAPRGEASPDGGNDGFLAKYSSVIKSFTPWIKPISSEK